VPGLPPQECQREVGSGKSGVYGSLPVNRQVVPTEKSIRVKSDTETNALVWAADGRAS